MNSKTEHLLLCCHKNSQLHYRPVVYFLSGYLLSWGKEPQLNKDKLKNLPLVIKELKDKASTSS